MGNEMASQQSRTPFRGPAADSTGPAGKLRRKLREVGWPYTLQLIAEHLIPRSLFEFGWFHLCELDLDVVEPPDVEDLTIREAKPQDVARLAEVEPRIRESLEAKGRAWLAFRDRRLLAFMWFEAADHRRFSWLRLQIGPGEIFGASLHVEAASRGQGVGPRLNRYISCRLRDAGFRRVVSCVDCLNRNSLRADRKVGYRLLCPVAMVRVLGLAVLRINGRTHVGCWSARHPLLVSVAEIRRDLESRS